MLKHKKFLSLLLVLPLFSVFSCAKAKEDYPIHTDPLPSQLKVEGELRKKTYETNKGEVLSLDGLTIKIDNTESTNRINKKEDILNNGYFVCSRKDLPSNTIIGSDFKAGTNVEVSSFTFYIATALEVNGSYEIFVSEGYTVTITNSNAIKPWVWYTITAVVVFGVIGMVMFTRHRKMKKEEKA